jgi:hypothetical protein
MIIINENENRNGGDNGGGDYLVSSGGGGGVDNDEKMNNIKIINEANHSIDQFNYFNYWNKNPKQLINLDEIELDLDDKNENEDLNQAFIDDYCTTKTSSEKENNSSLNYYYYLRKLEQYEFEIDKFLKNDKETLIKNEISNSVETIVINLPINDTPTTTTTTTTNNNNLDASQQNILKTPHQNLATTTSNSSSNNLITTTRFLHPSTSPSSLENSSSSSLPPGASNLLLTPTTTRTLTNNNNNNNNNDTSVGVVSKLKSWFKKPSNMNTTSNQNNNNNNIQLNRANSCGMEQTTVNLTSISSSVLIHQPLSIDLVRKLKRPTNIPYSLEYNSNQIFQGSALEEWIMQTLDDYIKNTPALLVPNLNNNLINMNELTSSTANMNNVYTPSLGSQSQSSIVIENFEETYIINCDPTNGSTNISKASCVIDDQQTSFVSKSNNKLITNSDNNLIDLPSDNEVMFDLASNTNNNNNNNIIYNTNDISNVHSNNLNNNNNNMSLNITALRRQEANFYVQQILTNLIAIGVLEYESGFENAINKTFKVIIGNYQ